ncbi:MULTISPECIES: hypothetical protein [unclassified Streptomyces]|uniref:Lipoprotein n=1 Tax=Streptomyces sp. NBC_00180 TaxID=2903632 RepID=A0AAU1HZG8_9ACTN|nr:hypothetical protein OG331_28240 [Streptomyces sp. NBC_01017]
MIRNRIAAIAATTAAAALLLTACNGSENAASAAREGAGSAQGGLSFTSGSAKQNNAAPGTGDWANSPGKPASRPVAKKWVQLSASQAGDLNPVVVNGAGFTLYRFDKDTANPSRSNCSGECATTWPPVLVAPGGKIFIDGVDKSDVGVVKRDDGNLQVTVGGWPVYRFSKDLGPGDTNGQGVGGTWFGVTPDGRKAGAGEEGGDAGSEEGGAGDEQGDVAPASSVTLSDERNFGDPSEGLAGAGCQNVARDDSASSLQASGTLKIWSEKDCKGDSKVVQGNIADLASVGFDDRISSVFLG